MFWWCCHSWLLQALLVVMQLRVAQANLFAGPDLACGDVLVFEVLCVCMGKPDMCGWLAGWLAVLLGVCRTYTYSARANGTGSLVNLVTLPKADNNATNNNATSTVTVLGTCANPFGNGTQLNCPDGSVTNATAANNTFEDAGTFPSVCCVSVVCCVAWCVRGCSCWPRRQSVPWAHPQHMPCSSRVATTG